MSSREGCVCVLAQLVTRRRFHRVRQNSDKFCNIFNCLLISIKQANPSAFLPITYEGVFSLPSALLSDVCSLLRAMNDCRAARTGPETSTLRTILTNSC